MRLTIRRKPHSYDLNVTAGAFVALALVACAKERPAPSTDTTPAQSQPRTTAMPMSGADCPVGVSGTTVTSTDTPDGTDVTFRTTGDVTELRRRVRAMADHMNRRSTMRQGMGNGSDAGAPMGPGMGQGMGPGMGQGMGQGMGGMGMHGRGMMMGGDAGAYGGRMGMMPPTHADVDDVEGGARMRLVPVDPSQRDELQRRMQGHVQMMTQRRDCPGTAPPPER